MIFRFSPGKRHKLFNNIGLYVTTHISQQPCFMIEKPKDLIKAIQGLLAFTGKVLAVTLLYNIICFLIMKGLPPSLFSRIYTMLIFSDALFFMILGVILIVNSFFSTIERHTYRHIGLGRWIYKRIERPRQQERRHDLLRGITLIIIGILFWFLPTFISL